MSSDTTTTIEAARRILGHGLVAFDAIVRMGEKGPSGAPTGREGWQIAATHEEERAGPKGRPISFHPHRADCYTWNDRPIEDRATIRGYLSGRVSDVAAFRRACQDPPAAAGKGPAGGGAWCSSTDSEQASRWDPQAGAFRSLACPGESCEHARARRCKPQSTLYVRLDEPGIPSLMCRMRTQGWRSSRGMLGVIEALAALGVETVRRVPISMTIEIVRSAGRSYPVVRYVLGEPDTGPGPDPVPGDAAPAAPDEQPEPPPAAAPGWRDRYRASLLHLGLEPADADAEVATATDADAARARYAVLRGGAR